MQRCGEFREITRVQEWPIAGRQEETRWTPLQDRSRRREAYATDGLNEIAFCRTTAGTVSETLPQYGDSRSWVDISNSRNLGDGEAFVNQPRGKFGRNGNI